MNDTVIRDMVIRRYLTPYSSRTWLDRWTNPDSLRGKQLDLEEKLSAAQIAIAERLMEPLEEVAALLRAWWNSQPGMPYTAPSLWDASQMAADRGAETP